ncbi:MAG: hypothetical protein OEU76_03775 [Cyclobacteriaceae bacterium]|nr:hypothetical protein [Cyclobacteriaceae bacterium]
MRISNFLVAMVFLVFAALSVNRPNPVIWILINGSMSVVAILAMFNFYRRIVIAVLFIVLFSYGSIFLSGMKEWAVNGSQATTLFCLEDSRPYLDDARRFVWLVGCEMILIIYFIRSLDKIKKKN